MRDARKTILLTFDVEDWFQVENFKQYIKFSTWNSYEGRVERNTTLLLDLLDTFEGQPRATFFILGWTAEKYPGLVRKIHNRGHEVASHGFNHHLCTALSSSELLEDLEKSKTVLEDLTGREIKGYRAPSFAVTDDILEIIHEAGFTYDSSYNSFAGHDRYGKIDLSTAERTGSVYKLKQGLHEIPVSNLNLYGRTFPLGGGGYFRLLPFPLFKQGMKKVLADTDPFVFYAHPWEFDPGQPMVNEASRWFKFRHYINLHRTQRKLETLITAFPKCRFTTCTDYLKTITQ